ncbi:MAG: DUF2721 domain-containing protein [Bradyrhizobium sp.]|uniref:DUF2721 domain-containing protein n=1 Tax=Bradyrhizobium sp. TaxID=376 RepID=UPI001DA6FB24|nr:DUF2721 domain-containing protein [Bradyrhizobium sp.]MBV9563680.1 DUF2721 domain-containing protein [Bradyrhizobium sp.]
MGNSIGEPSVAAISAMVTPALLILASASLAASALVRMARVVDRARFLAGIVHDRTWERTGLTTAQLRTSLERHAARARYAEGSILLLYAAIVIFVLTCLSIPLDAATGRRLTWLPPALAIAGALLLLGGGALMVAESQLSGRQIADEIETVLEQLKGTLP